MQDNFEAFELKDYLEKSSIDLKHHSKKGLESLLQLLLVGKKATANHPITTLNPDKEFNIESVKIEGENEEMRVFIRGSETCWFGANMWKLVE